MSNRYLVNFRAKDVEREYHDVIIIGSGIAGVFTALQAKPDMDVAILTKETMDISNSVLAQGGIAVSLDKEDSPDLHFKDTLYAGAGLCNEDTVWVLVNEAAGNIDSLCEYGVNFDKKSNDQLSLTREGAHSKNRIIHAGDTTGKEVLDKLLAEAVQRPNITLKERICAVDILTEENQCKGVLAYVEAEGKLKMFIAPVVILAAGGYGQLYANTTNPEISTGDGACIAYRAGAELMDIEFVQFHPTVLYHPENKNFLISEAVRGEGAILRNVHGERFMPNYHELKELAPRDVVSRAIFEEMKKTNSKHVYLDITAKDKEYLENRFPNIYKTCLGYGIDISKDYIPVAPAEHYCMGGVRVDVFGRTKIQGLFACGEVACNGIHGANRLASNSLLEGLVFGNKIAELISETLKERSHTDIKIEYEAIREELTIDCKDIISKIQTLMTKKAGIVRNGKELSQALVELDKIYDTIKGMKNDNVAHFELQNVTLLSRLLVKSALQREESRGAHFRSDFPDTDNDNWRKNIILSESN